DQDRGQGPGGGREPAVDVLRDPDRVRPGFGDQDAEDVPRDRGEGAVVEDRGAPLQQPPLLELGRTAGPAELRVPPPPDGPDGEDAERQVRQYDPPEDLQGAHGRPSGLAGTPRSARWPVPVGAVRESGGANGSRPASSAGGAGPHARRA